MVWFNKDCSYTRAKCVIWIWIRHAHLELKFERQYFGPCVRQITLRCVIWNAVSIDGPEVLSSYASRKSRSEITVWMPWPLNRDLGGRAKWPSNHFHQYTRAAYVQKHRKCKLCACLIGRVPRHSSPAGMHNPKLGLSAYFKMRNSNDNSNYALCSRVKNSQSMHVSWEKYTLTIE